MPVRGASAPLLLTVLGFLALAAAGCGQDGRRGSGCKKDTDCKGDRVCVAGRCEEQATTPAHPAQQPPAKAAAPTPPPAPAPAPNPVAMAADGLPVVIPPPSSPPPTVAEWDSVPREVTVAGSSALGCETKMLREWLRVSCRKHGADMPLDVRSERTDGQQAYVFRTAGTVASTVVQVVRGKEYRAAFVWDTRGRHWESKLFVSWPVQNPRPAMYFRQ